jgi:methylthioribose-1-phosphate isomerase
MPAEQNPAVDTLRWNDGVLEMIDQRLLPARVEYVRFDSAAAVADGIQKMVVRGAPAIGCAAAYGVALEALRQKDQSASQFSARMEEAFSILAASRPTAVNLAWALQRMRDVMRTDATPAEMAERLLDVAHQIHAEDIRVNRAIGEHGAQLLPDGARIMTHCNAGSLATAGHGTALGVIRSAIAHGKKLTVVAGETRPFLQGARLTVWELMRDGIPVTLITDNMAGHLMSRGEIDAVIVGTDRVAANGDVANKIGTYMIAVLAKRHGIPFYVACPLSTLDLSLENGAAIPIEERASSEVTGYGDVQWAAEGVTVRNPSFDVTPADLVTAIITEQGVIFQPTREKLAALSWSSDGGTVPTGVRPLLLSMIFSFRNEEENIPELVRRVSDAVNSVEGVTCEMVFVNDDSTDRSLEVLKELQARYPIRIVNMSRRFGVTPCVLAGFENMRGDAAITMDTDLQDPPDMIPEMVARFRAGAEVVHTTRTHREGEGPFKMWLTKRAYRVINYFSDIHLPENTGDFKLLSRRVVGEILNLSESDPYLRGLAVWVGYKQDFIYYRRQARYTGKTHFPLLSKGPVREFVRGLASFSAAPLYFALLSGFATTAFSMALVLYALVAKLTGVAVQGTSGILIAISFFSGVILFTIGLIGLYVGRIYNEVKGRPRYIVKEILEPSPRTN